ncbi:MAG: nucleotide exchange factor GrpE [Candidatus Cloacimonetes bacterium]|nr:nucleotide exchange factor GrpE [Candidatus Cloacimonadota bacterium]
MSETEKARNVEQQEKSAETVADTVVETEVAAELSIEEKLEQLEREKAELKDKWLRSVAEFDNFRRRSNAEKSTWIKNANQRLVLELCDVNDNFERALSVEHEQKEAGNFQKGIELIFKQIGNILKREGVEKIETNQKDFDPEYHEALAHIPSELEENKIAATIKNGYLMNGKLIRAAQVAVSNGEKPAETANVKIENKKEKNRNRRK